MTAMKVPAANSQISNLVCSSMWLLLASKRLNVRNARGVPLSQRAELATSQPTSVAGRWRLRFRRRSSQFSLNTVEALGYLVTAGRVKQKVRYVRRFHFNGEDDAKAEIRAAARYLLKSAVGSDRRDIVRKIIAIVDEVARGLPLEGQDPPDDGMPGG